MTAAAQLITDNLDIWASAVKTKSAAGRGKSSKLELYGIKKLRELILELAVRGLLVPQDPNDEPASELLKKVAAGKAKLVKDGKIKKPKISPEIEVEEKPFELPEGWHWARLQQVCVLENGDRSKSYPNKSVLVDSGIPFVNAGHLQGGRIDKGEMTFITEERYDLLKAGKFSDGDILFCLRGSLGKSAIVEGFERGAIASSLVIVRLVEPLNRYYFLSYFDSPLSYRMIQLYDNGTAQPNMSAGGLGKFLVPLPPIPEQARIVAKVDELMTLCDQLEQQQEASITAHQTLVQTLLDALTTASEHDDFTAAWARIADHFDTLFTTEWSIDQLKQTILQLAVMGKLVPQDPHDEPAAELLKKIAAEKAKLVQDGMIKKQKTLPPIEEGETPFDLPGGWEWARLSDVASVIDPNPSHRMPKYVENGIPFISTENFTNGGIDFSIGKQVEESVLEEQVSKFEIRDGSFAMSRIGTIGKTIFLPKNRDYCMSHALCVISPYLNIFSHDFLKFVVSAESSLAQAHSGVQSIGVPDLGMGVIRSFLIPVPPLREQDRVVSKVEELLDLCGTLKSQLRTAQTTQLHLAGAMTGQAVM